MRQNECTKASLLLFGRRFLGLGRSLGGSLAFGGGLGLADLASNSAAACAAARWAASAASSCRTLGLGDQRAALGEELGLVGRTGDQHADLDRDLRMEVDLDLVRAQRLDRLVELDLAALDLDACGGGAVGDVARGDRAVELQGLGGLADER